MFLIGISLLVYVILNYLAYHYALHKFFADSGKNPWRSLIPVVYVFDWLEITNRPKWLFSLLLVPVVNIWFAFVLLIDIVAAYKKVTIKDSLAIALSGGVHVAYVVRKYAYSKNENTYSRSAFQAVLSLCFAVVLASSIRLFLVEAFIIPTPAMDKTLLVGDYFFVSKSAYGFRLPNTLLALPFVHHTNPLTGGKAYVEWIKLPYIRMFAQKVKRNDMVVFNYPAGDTVVLENQGPSYYDLIRYTAYSNRVSYAEAREFMWSNSSVHITTRPVDKREHYVKRCVGIAGDTLQIIDGELYINNAPGYRPKNLYTPYFIAFKDNIELNEDFMNKLEIENITERMGQMPPGHFLVLMTKTHAEELKALNITTMLQPFYYRKGEVQEPIENLFPYDTLHYKWNVDNFGPLIIPAKGWTVTLNDSIYKLYDRAISVYENNKVEQRDGKFFINGKETSTYTFKMDYYWMMGDNRHNSQDSRYWGFVPEDHIAGKAASIWFSADRAGHVRQKRIFTSIHDQWAPKDKKFTE